MKVSSSFKNQDVAHDPQALFYTCFEPEGQKIKATIIILHGMQEHSGRYIKLATFFASQGFAVLTYDHMGHGKTAKSPQDFSYFQRKGGAQQVIHDAAMMAQHLHALYPNVKHFLMGVSMGSFVARGLLQENKLAFDAAILLATGQKTPGAELLKGFLALINRFSAHQTSKKINAIFSTMNNQKFKEERPQDGTNWLSVNKENRQRFKQDPLCGIPFSNNGFYVLLCLHVRATHKNWMKGIPQKLPILLISGQEDPIGDFGKGVQATAMGLLKAGFLRTELKLYPGVRHEILHEDIQFDVYQDINTWLHKFIPLE